MIQFDEPIFQMGWFNHQLEHLCCHAALDIHLPTSPEELLGVGMNFAAVVSGIFGA